jgi:hypothetical protein
MKTACAIAVLVLTTLSASADAEKPTIDVSFSLECRGLESYDGGEIYLGSVTEYERFPAIQKMVADEQRKNATLPLGVPYRALLFKDGSHTGVKYYDAGLRIAFNHGIPDGNWAVEGLRVVGATPEAFTLGGRPPGHEKGIGIFDRRTGHGEVMYYDHIDPNTFKTTHDGSGVMAVTKQFIYECEASRPGKF